MQFSTNFLKRCESFHTVAQRTWGRRFLARREEIRLAGGTEVTGYSDYASGDDYRYVDWSRCARHDELLSKQFQGNEDQYVYFLLDCSSSMQREDGGKLDVALRLTAALGYLALANLDRVGVTAFAERIVRELPPVRGRRHVPRLLKFLTDVPREKSTTNLKNTTETFVRRGRPTGLVVVVSDMFDPAGFEPAIDVLRRRDYEPYVLQVYDRIDAEPDLLGKFRLHDVESERSYLRMIDEQDMANYRDVFREFGESLRRYCFRYSIGLTQTRTDVPLEQCLERMIQAARR